MRICIDSCVFITGLTQQDSPDAKLLDLVGPDLYLVIPRLVAQEVTRNLQTPEQVRLFYHLFSHHRFAFVVDEPVPRPLVEDYVVRGLREKADAFIGAFAEWMEVRYLISDNRHFLRELKVESYLVIGPKEFIERWDKGTL